MTHKDFVLIAGAIADARAFAAEHPEQCADVGVTIACTLADRLRYANPRFDSARFLAACEGKPLTGRDKVQS